LQVNFLLCKSWILQKKLCFFHRQVWVLHQQFFHWSQVVLVHPHFADGMDSLEICGLGWGDPLLLLDTCNETVETLLGSSNCICCSRCFPSYTDFERRPTPIHSKLSPSRCAA